MGAVTVMTSDDSNSVETCIVVRIILDISSLTAFDVTVVSDLWVNGCGDLFGV